MMVPHSGTSNSYTFKRCQDGVKNGNEADVDCGGDCPACATGKTCRTDSDCVGKCDQTKKTCATSKYLCSLKQDGWLLDFFKMPM